MRDPEKTDMIWTLRCQTLLYVSTNVFEPYSLIFRGGKFVRPLKKAR